MKKLFGLSIILAIVIATVLLVGILPSLAAPKTILSTNAVVPNAPQSISGVVYRDLNANGVRDTATGDINTSPQFPEPGVGGVTVTAYPASASGTSGAVSTTTANDGTFSLNVGAGEWRLEVTDLPAYLFDGAAGSTTVVFVSDGTTNVEIGVNNPAQYSQADPAIASVLLSQGAYNGPYANNPGLISMRRSVVGAEAHNGTVTGDPYAPPNYTQLSTFGQIGAAYGMAWDRTHGYLYTAAFHKYLVGYGPGGRGQIYRTPVDPSTGQSTGAPQQWVNVETDLGFTLCGGHGGDIDSPPSAYEQTYFDQVGRCGMGDIDLSWDDSTLYVVLINDNKVIGIDTDTGALSGQWAIPAPADAGRCSGNIYPFGMATKDDKVYVGSACDNEQMIYIQALTPASSSWTTVLAFDPETDGTDPVEPGSGDPWITTITDATNSGGYRSWRQMVVGDLAFFGEDLTIGIRDRMGDQWGHQVPDPDGGNTNTQPFGNIWCAYYDTGSGSYVYPQREGGSDKNVPQTCGPNRVTTTPNPSPEWFGGEFYWGDGTNTKYGQTIHTEPVSGALAQWLLDDVVVSSKTPQDAIGYSDTDRGGIHWINNVDGAPTHAFEIYQSDPGEFGKANGLGDLEALSYPAPLEVGNRLWCDLGDGNGVGAENGIQDPGEEVVANATVILECDTDGDPGNGYEASATTTTDANGNYLFKDNAGDITTANGWPAASWDSNIAIIPRNAQCRIKIDPTQSAIANSCGAGSYGATTPNNGGSDPGADLRDSDGTDNFDGAGNVGTTFTTGGSGQNDHSLDFGFKPQAAKDWGDLPDSFATLNASSGPSHVITSDLYLGSCVDAESDGQPDNHAGADGAGSGNGDDGNTGTATTGTCAQNGDDEDGVTLTTPLIPGAQACFNVSAHNATANDVNIYAWIDWNGDGDFGSGGTVDANESFVLGTVPANTDWTDQEVCTNVPADATFDGGEVHMRFRFTSDSLSDTDWGGAANDGEVEDYWQPLACAGNYVWDDTNGSSSDVQDASDSGIGSVTVRMVWAGPDGVIDTSATDATAQNDDQIYTATTDNNGVYNFCGLTPDTYRMQIPTPPAGTPDAVTPNQGDDVHDSDGTQAGGSGTAVEGPDFTVSDPISLPTGENGNQDNPGAINNFPDAQDDLTFDFGFREPAPPPPTYDWGDLPDSFSTLDASGGPSHQIGAELYLGSCVDEEGDGQPDAHAGADGGGSGKGDDGNAGTATGVCTNGDDEDGVTLTTPLIPGAQACFNVTAHNAKTSDANIYAWIDWNGDGDFGSGGTVDANEAFVLGTVPANTDWTDQEVCTNVPADATFDGGETHMRFRLTTDALSDTDWGGVANDGEVEDYWQPLVCVGNYLWMDIGSSPNVQDSGDDPVADGTQVNLTWAGPDGDINATGDNVTYSTTTANGIYNFCGLVSDANGDGTNDDYRVSVPTLPGPPVTADQGSDDLDSDGDSSGNGPVFTVSIPTGVTDNAPNDTDPNNFPDDNTDLTFDFGFQQTKVAIGNFVWHDANANSTFDSGSEAGIDNIGVELYRDVDGDGVCEPGGDDGAAVATTTTSGGGFYQFLSVDPSATGDATTYYCVAVVKSDVTNAGYAYNSSGGAQNPDATGDHDQPNGDDGVPSGNYVVSQPFAATVNGQTNTSDTGDPAGYPDNSAYMTVDFGFLTQQDYDAHGANAVTMQSMDARTKSGMWAVVLLIIGLTGLMTFVWRRRRAM